MIYIVIFNVFIDKVTLGCGGRTSENMTYFSSRGTPDANPTTNELCTGTVCKCDPNVCQLRLDFMMFSLEGI